MISRRRSLELIGTSASISTFGAQNVLAGRSTATLGRGAGVQFLNLGNIEETYRPKSRIDFTIDGKTHASDLAFGELSATAEINTGKHEIVVSSDNGSSKVRETITTTSGQDIIAITGGKGDQPPSVGTLNEEEMFGGRSDGVSFANLTELDRVEVKTGSEVSRVNSYSVSDPLNPENIPAEFVVQADNDDQSWRFDREGKAELPQLVLIGGFVGDSGLPFGTKTIHRGK